MNRFGILFAALLVLVSNLAHAESYANCYNWSLSWKNGRAAYDGETLYAIIPGTGKKAVRLRGVDTPEIKAATKAERKAAYKARDHLNTLLKTAALFLFCNPEIGYYGRIVATIFIDGQRAEILMINSGLQEQTCPL